MEDLVRSLERGWELFSRVAPLLCLAAVLWLGMNGITRGLLIGPALVGLFAIALRAHEGKAVDLGRAFVAFDDISVPLLAGLVLWAPFAVVGALHDPPLFLWLILLPWFALSMPLLFVLADRPSLSPTEAVQAAYRIAVGDSESTSHSNALGLHVLHGSTALLVLGLSCRFLSWLTHWSTVSHFLVLGVGGPVVICALTAHHAARILPSSVESGAEGESPSGDDEASPEQDDESDEDKSEDSSAPQED